MTDDTPKRPDRPRAFSDRKPTGDRKPFKPRSAPRAEPEEAEAGERIAKRLARVGVASRREAEGLIADGRIRVNGEVLTSPARNVLPSDRIELDGNLLSAPERTRLFLFHKPAGVVTTNRDPEGRKTVFDALPDGLPRLMTVGRLDINTEGLLLLTNDGGLSRVLELPATGWLRRYRVRVHGEVDEAKLKELAEGIAVDGVFYGAIEASLERKQGSNAWLTVGLREGKNREVKNVMGALGLEVNRLIRVSFGPFQLGELAEGEVQELKGRTLRDQLGERLIAEAGADFDGEIQKPFTNRPTARERDSTERPERAPREVEVGEGGLIKNRKRFREERRESALDRLTTRTPRAPGGPRGGGAGRGKTEKFEPERPRGANVWMAPGARPRSKEGEEERPRGQRPGRAEREAARGETSGARAPFRKEGGGERTQRRKPEDAGAPKRFTPRDDRPRREEGERPFRPRRDDREGGERPPRREFGGNRPERREEGGTERPRSFRPRTEGRGPATGRNENRPPRRDDREGGERPPRREFGASRPERRSDEGGDNKPRTFKSRSEGKPRGEGKPFTPRGDGERPRSFKPGGGGGKPGGFKPGGPKRFGGDKPRTAGDRPRPAGDRPRGPKPGGGGRPSRGPRGS